MDRPELALALPEINAVKFGAFKLKLHETHPEAPLSPLYFNLRMPPKGPLTPGLVQQLGGALLYGITFTHGLRFDAVAGVPEAGDPFAAALAYAARVPLLLLGKEESAQGRRIVPGCLEDAMKEHGIVAGDRVLLIDDLITQAHSKIEAAELLRSYGLTVDDVLVILDREQGGREVLATVGIALHAAWQVSELLALYWEKDIITLEKYAEVLLYLEENKK